MPLSTCAVRRQPILRHLFRLPFLYFMPTFSTCTIYNEPLFSWLVTDLLFSAGSPNFPTLSYRCAMLSFAPFISARQLSDKRGLHMLVASKSSVFREWDNFWHGWENKDILPEALYGDSSVSRISLLVAGEISGSEAPGCDCVACWRLAIDVGYVWTSIYCVVLAWHSMSFTFGWWWNTWISSGVGPALT